MESEGAKPSALHPLPSSLYGFRLIPAQSGKRRLCIHIAKSVSFPTPFSRIESRNLLDSIGIRINQWCGQFRGGKEEISGTVRLK
ncbi:hypothetical protein DVJ83_10075 [Deinococcus wulumuqiensis]|uniref:Uncharacterized protein n=1 Tax=Deinococcus wulumuqiensis TaxID=980427 RepID=A0A345IIA0_9DEIO|nr:hypothetical protein DVJ83_10075 [Deinococcus wulumuqiensis]